MQAAARRTVAQLARPGQQQMRGFGTHKIDTAYETGQFNLWKRVTLFAAVRGARKGEQQHSIHDP